MKQNIGTQLLYYSYKGNKQIAAPRIKQLLDAGTPLELDYAAIPAFLLYQYSIGGDTLFKDIRVSQWNQVSPAKASQLDESLLTEQLLKLIHKSITDRTAKAQRVSLLLSGGIDSSVVGTIATNVLGNKIQHAFTATFDAHSELNWALRVADFLKLKLHEVCITANMVAKNIESITATYEEPLGDAALINNYFLC